MKPLAILIVVAFVVGGPLAQAQDSRAPQPQALLDEAVMQLQSAASFRLAIEQSGKPYQLALTFDGVNMLPATLESAEAQVIIPSELHINANLRLIIPLTMEIYARDDRQWLSFPAGAPWLPLPAFADFDVSRLLAPGDGIEKVLTNLKEPQIADDEALVEERLAWRIEATAAGEAVKVLLFGFIDPIDDVAIDAYITSADGRLALIEILMLETVDDAASEPTVWHIKFYDYDERRGFEAPAG